MDIRFQNLGPESWSAQIVIGFSFEGEDFLAVNPEFDAICPWLAIAPAKADFKGRKGELAIIYGHPELKIPRVLLIGLGKRENLTLADIREHLGEGVKKCRYLGIESLLAPASMLGRLPYGTDRLIEECVYAALISLYQFTEFKTDKTEIPDAPRWLAIGFENQEQAESGQQAARKGESAALAVRMARDLDNTPGNRLYPEMLALKANTLAAEAGFKCQVLNERALSENDLGCLMAVGQGSAHPPRLIILEYAPEESSKEKPLVLIGKGITFDSGGLCLKPAANMNQMKCDMSGAAAVLATITALAREKAPKRVIGLLACAENMPDGGAYRPGDIIYAGNGQSVEVINTDAEGRLALCDALCYAQKHWDASAIIDIATLTGACAIALGNQLAGLFCGHEELAEKIMAYGTAVGENFWRLPLWEGYEKSLKSEVADISHTAAREGGAITAALFLKHFVKADAIWAHMDIAGVDWNAKASALCPEGATGFGVRTLLQLGRGGKP